METLQTLVASLYLTMYHISVFCMKLTVKRLGDTYKLIYHKYGSRGVSFDLEHSPKGETSGEKEDCNLARTKSAIRELALCNVWDWFITLTLSAEKQDRYDIDSYVRDLGVWIGNYNKRFNTKLKYLLIPEQHKKDGAWHMHGLFSGVSASSVVVNRFGYKTIPYYERRFGYLSMSEVHDSKRTASYITKYVSKAISATDISINKHMFYHSRGLNRAETFFETNVREMPIEVWQNDFVGIEYADSDEALASLLNRLEELS